MFLHFYKIKPLGEISKCAVSHSKRHLFNERGRCSDISEEMRQDLWGLPPRLNRFLGETLKFSYESKGTRLISVSTAHQGLTQLLTNFLMNHFIKDLGGDTNMMCRASQQAVLSELRCSAVCYESCLWVFWGQGLWWRSLPTSGCFYRMFVWQTRWWS